MTQLFVELHLGCASKSLPFLLYGLTYLYMLYVFSVGVVLYNLSTLLLQRSVGDDVLVCYVSSFVLLCSSHFV